MSNDYKDSLNSNEGSNQNPSKSVNLQHQVPEESYNEVLNKEKIEKIIPDFFNNPNLVMKELSSAISQLKNVDYNYFKSTNIHDFIIEYILQETDDSLFYDAYTIFYLTTNRKIFSSETQILGCFIEKTIEYIRHHESNADFPLASLSVIAASSQDFIETFLGSGFFDFVFSIVSTENIPIKLVAIAAYLIRHCITYIPIQDAPKIVNLGVFILKLNVSEEIELKVFSGFCDALDRIDLMLYLLENNFLEEIITLLELNDKIITYGCLSFIEILANFNFPEDEDPYFPHPIQFILETPLISHLIQLIFNEDQNVYETVINILHRFIVFNGDCLDLILNEDSVNKMCEIMEESSFDSQRMAVYFICEIIACTHNLKFWEHIVNKGGIEGILRILESNDDKMTREIITALEHGISILPETVIPLIENGAIEILEELAQDEECSHPDACMALVKRIKVEAKRIAKRNR
ncbi:hypothetical protein TVAG_476620 [Trichomonas vaginalis G3]|uniref:Uncharacterized protein n=1 Tax=Trichomonas vaginalis (strain ATCC PRA-98 / G3) TaxID=412133 RepID=A2DA85_TRIV3|nr:armadillo (ARM) repeat-containing protein family [Trichomonas vaginalis G3]EAY22733.1 hypothetical protein TVAG_476620 [Trichomonas vaginalis G3]KAI5525544.1 armadillo (ARM) repeat-containing protein family [Trichomonas vaginalis G3]|eukprot:XP_001583719.1 hypothetical protein [Trichomonas vaginalis G3]